MTRPDGRTDMSRPGNRTAAATTLVGLLVLLVGVAGGLGGALVVAGTTALVTGGLSLARGRAARFAVLDRRTGAGAVVAGLLVVAAGAVVAPSGPRTVEAEGAAVASVPTAPATATPAPPPPALVMTCPSGSGASPVFGQQITAVAPYRVAIDYGDDDRYADDDLHLGAVFSHTYRAAGTFTVTAEVTDATARTASATCTYTWGGRTR